MIKIELTDKEKAGLTKDEIEIAMARKLELLILPHIRRNIDFFYAGANIPKKSKAYHRTITDKDIKDAIEHKTKNVSTVCKPICNMVAEILKNNGINAETVSCDTDMFRHTDILITTSSGKQYIINYLEDIENVQTGMKTPDFASKKYYERRYKKFEGSTTTDGKKIDRIDFLSDEKIDKIDTNLGYKKYGMYMNDVINQIKKEFTDFTKIISENEYLAEECKLEKTKKLQADEKEKLRAKIEEKYNKMPEDEILERKLDWIFEYFNDRMELSGHTDFVMYYSRLLLKEVLMPKEYEKLKRYDCFVLKKNLHQAEEIKDILDVDNEENEIKVRFCMLKLGEKAYVFSTKPNRYKKLSKKEMENIKEYSTVLEAQKPSDLVLMLCDKGNALPLVFHPLGSRILNERADEIDKKLSPEERKKLIWELAQDIETEDEPVTSITIPYTDGTKKFLYINENNEFAVREGKKTTIYHYHEDTDSFVKEEQDGTER